MINMERKSRESNIELLKIIAMAIMVISHALPYGSFSNYDLYTNLNYATNNISNIILVFVKYAACISNCVFIICSCYFLIDNDKVKLKKVIKIILDTFIICSLFLVVLLLLKFNISMDMIISMLFPIAFNSVWFITCYLLLYIFHPYFNIVINKLSKKGLININIILIILYSIIATIKFNLFYANLFVEFIMIYFLLAYVKKYMPNLKSNIKLNKKILLVSVISLILLVLSTNYIELLIPALQNNLLHWNQFNSPIIILVALSIFNIFSQKNIKNSLTLYIYILHANPLVEAYLKPLYYQYINSIGISNIIVGSALLSIIYIITSLLLAILYVKLFSKITNKIVEVIETFINKVMNKIYKVL